MPDRQTCRNCNGTGRVSTRAAFAGICTHCVRGVVVTRESLEPACPHCRKVGAHAPTCIEVMAEAVERLTHKSPDREADHG